jgi:hypothetical protein
MQYRQFEEALVQMFSIREASLGAFRARLRHLRKLGIPNIPKRGSGNTFIYRVEDLFTTFVALALQTLGSTPTISAMIANATARWLRRLTFEKEDIFVPHRPIRVVRADLIVDLPQYALAYARIPLRVGLCMRPRSEEKSMPNSEIQTHGEPRAHRSGRPTIWTLEARSLLYDRLFELFGPARDWDSRKPGRGKDALYEEFLDSFNKVNRLRFPTHRGRQRSRLGSGARYDRYG